MNRNLATLLIALLLCFMSDVARAEINISPLEANERVQKGQAILIDVREPDEWAEGVATPAHLLSLTELNGSRENWKPVLEANKDKQIILYCRSGNRSGKAAKTLADEGYTTLNMGPFTAWQGANLPTKKPE